MALDSELVSGFFNVATAQEVGIRLQAHLGDRPFTFFTKDNPTHPSKVMRLVGGEEAVTYHPEGVRSCLILNTTRGFVELTFGAGLHNRNLVYRFTAEGNFVIEDAHQPDRVAVVMPLRAPKPQASGTRGLVPGTEYLLHSGTVDEMAGRMLARLGGSTVVFANPDTVEGLDRFRFPTVVNAWIGGGYDHRLLLELDGTDVDGTPFEDQVFLMGTSDGRPNEDSEHVTITFFADGNITLVVHGDDSVFRRSYVYWPIPCTA